MLSVMKGKLDILGFPEVLNLLGNAKTTGSLTLIKGEEIVIILLKEGDIIGIESFPKKIDTRLGHILLSQGNITKENLHQARDTQLKSMGRIGKILITKKLCDPHIVRTALRELALQLSYRLCHWGFGRYAFHPEVVLESESNCFNPISVEEFLEAARHMEDKWVDLRREISSGNILFFPVRTAGQENLISESKKKGSGGTAGMLSISDQYVLTFIDGTLSINELIEKTGLNDFTVYQSLIQFLKRGLVKKIGLRQHNVVQTIDSDQTAPLDSKLDDVDPNFDVILTELVGGNFADPNLPLALKMALQCGEDEMLDEVLQMELGEIEAAVDDDVMVPEFNARLEDFIIHHPFTMTACVFADDGRLKAEALGETVDQKQLRHLKELLATVIRKYPRPGLCRLIIDEEEAIIVMNRNSRGDNVMVIADTTVSMGAVLQWVSKLAQALENIAPQID